jgi:hypothetical protein
LCQSSTGVAAPRRDETVSDFASRQLANPPTPRSGRQPAKLARPFFAPFSFWIVQIVQIVQLAKQSQSCFFLGLDFSRALCGDSSSAGFSLEGSPVPFRALLQGWLVQGFLSFERRKAES